MKAVLGIGIVLFAGLVTLIIKWPMWTLIGLLVFSLLGYYGFVKIDARVNKGSKWPFFKQPEGTLCHKVKGGRYEAHYFSMPGYHVNPQGFIVPDLGNQVQANTQRGHRVVVTPEPAVRARRSVCSKMFGNLHFLNIFPHITLRHHVGFKWINPAPDGDSFLEKSANVVFWPTKFDTYGFVVVFRDRAKITGKLKGFGTFRIAHVSLPFFRNQNWLERTLQELQGGIAEYFSDHTLLELMSSEKEMGQILYDYLGDPATGQGDRVAQILQEIGIEFVRLRIVGAPELSPEDQALFSSEWAATQKAEAERKAAEIRIETAKKEAEAIKTRFEVLASILDDHPKMQDAITAMVLADGKAGASGSITDLLLLKMLGKEKGGGSD